MRRAPLIAPLLAAALGCSEPINDPLTAPATTAPPTTAAAAPAAPEAGEPTAGVNDHLCEPHFITQLEIPGLSVTSTVTNEAGEILWTEVHQAGETPPTMGELIAQWC